MSNSWQHPPAGFTLDCLVGRCALRTPISESPHASRGVAIDAILQYDEAALAAALDSSPDLADAADDEGVTPLHYSIVQGFTEGTALLLSKGADVFLPACRDQRHRVAGMPIYKTGGGTALHVAVESGELDDVQALLATAEKRHTGGGARLLAAADGDGLNAAQLAALLGRSPAMMELVDGVAWPAAEREAHKREWLRTQRARIDAVCRVREHERMQALRAAYLPLVPALFPPHAHTFGLSNAMLTPSVVGALHAGEVGTLARASTHVCPGVWALPLLSAAGCTALLDETRHFAASVGAGRVRRPNSMNHHGVVLADVGLDALVNAWVANLVTPLSHQLFKSAQVKSAQTEPITLETSQVRGVSSHSRPAALTGGSGSGGALVDVADGDVAGGDVADGDVADGDVARGPFGSVHAFTIRYRQGEDTDLAEHSDDSDLTVNVCLQADDVEGAALYFRAAGGETRRWTHVPGTAVIHRGSLKHGTEALERGVRTNLVMWCRQRRAE